MTMIAEREAKPTLPGTFGCSRMTPGHASAEHVRFDSERCRQEVAVSLFRAMKPGTIYTVRIEEHSGRQFPLEGFDRFLPPELWPHVHEVTVEVGVAEVMRMRVFEPAPIEAMPWPRLRRTAIQEVKWRIRSKVRQWVQAFKRQTGWHP